LTILPTVPNGTIKGKTPIDNEVVIIDTVPNETQEPSGQDVAKMVEDKIIAEARTDILATLPESKPVDTRAVPLSPVFFKKDFTAFTVVIISPRTNSSIIAAVIDFLPIRKKSGLQKSVKPIINAVDTRKELSKVADTKQA